MGLKKNVLYKGFLTFSNYLFGFVTFPYITRVLEPNNFGLVNFALNTVDYFLLFASLGINIIGTREIAYVKQDRKSLNSTFSQVLSINLCFTLLVLIIYIALINIVPQFKASKELFYVGSAKILFSALAVEWLFTGLENFKYITIRSFFIKFLYVTLVFILVKKPSDYGLYFILTIGSVVINSVVNFIYSLKFVKISYKHLLSFRYLKQNIVLGVYNIMTSMYITFNVMFLGLVSNNDQVGYYSTAVKLYYIFINLFSAFTAVMIPRMASLISENSEDKFSSYLIKSYNLVWSISIPLIIFGLIFAPQIIYVFSGKGYEDAILPMRILMPAVYMVMMSQVIVLQGLLPLKQDKIMLYTSVITGLWALILNFIITPTYGAVGSAIVLLSCEIIGFSFYYFKVKNKRLFILPKINKIKDKIIIGVIYLLIGILNSNIQNEILALCIGSLFFCLVFLIFFLNDRKCSQ